MRDGTMLVRALLSDPSDAAEQARKSFGPLIHDPEHGENERQRAIGERLCGFIPASVGPLLNDAVYGTTDHDGDHFQVAFLPRGVCRNLLQTAENDPIQLLFRVLFDVRGARQSPIDTVPGVDLPLADGQQKIADQRPLVRNRFGGKPLGQNFAEHLVYC